MTLYRGARVPDLRTFEEEQRRIRQQFNAPLSTSNLNVRSSPSYDREPFRVYVNTSSGEATDVYINVPQKNVPPEGYMVDIESLLLEDFGAYDETSEPRFKPGPSVFPVQIRNLVEPPYTSQGNQVAEDGFFFSCDNSQLVGDSSSGRYGLIMNKRVSMGDLSYKLSGRELQRMITVEPLFKNFGAMIMTLLFYPTPVMNNSTNSNLDSSSG